MCAVAAETTSLARPWPLNGASVTTAISQTSSDFSLMADQLAISPRIDQTTKISPSKRRRRSVPRGSLRSRRGGGARPGGGGGRLVRGGRRGAGGGGGRGRPAGRRGRGRGPRAPPGGGWGGRGRRPDRTRSNR